MSNTLTYKMLKEMVIKEMQLSLGQFGIGDDQDGATRRRVDKEIESAFLGYKTTTQRGKIEAKEDFQRMANGEDVIDEYEPEDSPSKNIRTKYYYNWLDEDFIKLLNKIENMENKV